MNKFLQRSRDLRSPGPLYDMGFNDAEGLFRPIVELAKKYTADPVNYGTCDCFDCFICDFKKALREIGE